MHHDHAHDEGGEPAPEIVEALASNHRSFLAFVEKRVGDRAIAEDILQDAFVRGMTKASSIENEESAVAWFYRVLRNAVIDHFRRRSSSSRALEAFAQELETEEHPPAEVRAQICHCVKELAETLKPEYAKALERIEIDEVSVKEYAEEAGITPNNAAVRVFRAREALKKQLAKSCRTCATHGCLDCTCAR